MTPGSTEALKQGCTCNTYKNCYGRGVYSIDKDRRVTRLFFVTEDCPLHDVKGERDEIGEEPASVIETPQEESNESKD